MAVELEGNVRMRGDTGPGVGVTVLAENERLRLVSGNELVGDWLMSEIGVNALQDGFNVRAEGEEFILRTQDDAAFAEELGLTAVSPRLGRRLAVRSNPAEPETRQERPDLASRVAAIGFALAGALVVLGGTFLNVSEETDVSALLESAETSDFEFWLAFVIGGVLMVGAAFVMSIGSRVPRVIATVVLLAVVVVFGLAVSRTEAAGTTRFTAYGLIAGGLVVGVAVLVSGSLRHPD